jgi:hypothetical protein
MTKHEFIRRLESLTPEQVQRVLPYLESDVEAVDRLADLHRDIDAGRRSVQTEPLEEADQVYERIRKSLR